MPSLKRICTFVSGQHSRFSDPPRHKETVSLHYPRLLLLYAFPTMMDHIPPNHEPKEILSPLHCFSQVFVIELSNLHNSPEQWRPERSMKASLVPFQLPGPNKHTGKDRPWITLQVLTGTQREERVCTLLFGGNAWFCMATWITC